MTLRQASKYVLTTADRVNVPKMPWAYGGECTFANDRLCECCASVRLERQLCIPNMSTSSFGFMLSSTKANNNCPMCRQLMASLENSGSLDHPPWGDRTMILVRLESFASLRKETGQTIQSAVQNMGHINRFYTDLIDSTTFAGQGSLGIGIYPKITRRYGFQLAESPVPDTRKHGYFGKARVIGNSEVEVDLLKGWDNHCLMEHKGVCQPTESAMGQDSFHPGFRVVDALSRCIVDAPAACSYVALSYVWGTAKQLLNEARNRPRLSRAGGLDDSHSDIPQTIKDAMLLCVSLGYQYLWVDALCIMQDDADDKMLQIHNMDIIYNRAALTIVVSGLYSSIFFFEDARKLKFFL